MACTGRRPSVTVGGFSDYSSYHSPGFSCGFPVTHRACRLPDRRRSTGRCRRDIRDVWSCWWWPWFDLKIINDLQQIDQTNFYALAISISVLVIITVQRKNLKKIPGALIAVIGAIGASSVLNLETHGIQVLGEIPAVYQR